LQHPEDYSPIVDRGDLEVPRGFLERMTGKRDLPSAGMGVELILAGNDGKVIATGSDISAGEKYWRRATSWVKVDVSEHTLDIKLAVNDPAVLADFVAAVTVGVSVVKARLVAERGILSVSDAVAPVLQNTIASATRPATASDDLEPAGRLEKARQTTETAIRDTLVGKPLENLPDWVSTQVKAVSVEFDEKTRQHYDELIAHGRKKQTINADEDNQDLQTGRGLKRDEMVREALRPHLMNPAWRAFEAAIKDPTPANIARAVAEANASDNAQLELKFQFLNQLMETNYVNDWEQLRDAMDQVQLTKDNSAESSTPATMGPGDAQPAIEAEAHTVEHQTEPHEQ
jgi:hypothetical protein